MGSAWKRKSFFWALHRFLWLWLALRSDWNIVTHWFWVWFNGFLNGLFVVIQSNDWMGSKLEWMSIHVSWCVWEIVWIDYNYPSRVEQEQTLFLPWVLAFGQCNVFNVLKLLDAGLTWLDGSAQIGLSGVLVLLGRGL